MPSGGDDGAWSAGASGASGAPGPAAVDRDLLPGVSVIIPHYGDPAPAQDLVRGLDDERLVAGPLEVIVVDDASPRPFPESDGVDLLLRRPANGGFGAAVNTGAARAGHELLLILNSDITITPGFVSGLVAAARPWQPALIGPRIVDAAGADAPSARRNPTAGQQVIEWLVPLARWRGLRFVRWAVGHETGSPARTAPVDWVIGAAMLVPTAAFRAVGGFDPGYFMNVEEVDLQRRLHACGIPTIHIGSIEVRHDAGTSSDPALRRRWLVASRLRYAEKWGGVRARRRLQAALTVASAVNFAWNGARRLVGRPVTPLTDLRRELALVRPAPEGASR